MAAAGVMVVVVPASGVPVVAVVQATAGTLSVV